MRNAHSARFWLASLILCVLLATAPVAFAQEDIPEGGTLVFASGFGVDIFNPVMTMEECRSCLWIFDSLIDLAPDMSPAPNLAESWEVNEDGTVYTFHLRQDVTWHDGEPFTADDVIFTFDRWLNDPASIWREGFVLGTDDAGNDQVVTVEKVDDHTVIFTLPRFDSQFLNKLAGYALIVPEHLLAGQTMEAALDFNLNPVGTGIFLFEEALPDQYARFSMNKDYWRGTPHLDEFIWAVIPDADAQVIALANGEIDVIKNVYTPDVEQRILDLGDVSIHQLLGTFTRTIYFNTRYFEPFQDQLVREAMALAFDKQAVVNALYPADAVVAHQMFNPDHWGFNPDVRVIEPDLDAARAKLAEAGWVDSDGDGIVEKDGTPLSFTIIVESQGTAPDAQAFQDYLRQIGIDVNIEIKERAVWREQRDTGEWESFLGWDGDAIMELALNFRSSTGWQGINNPEIDALLEVMSSALDPAERTAAAQEIMAISQEAVYSIPYLYYQSKIAVRDNIRGLQDPPTTADFQATGVFYHLEDLYMVSE